MPWCGGVDGTDWPRRARRPGVGQGKGRGVTKPRLRSKRRR